MVRLVTNYQSRCPRLWRVQIPNFCCCSKSIMTIATQCNKARKSWKRNPPRGRSVPQLPAELWGIIMKYKTKAALEEKWFFCSVCPNCRTEPRIWWDIDCWGGEAGCDCERRAYMKWIEDREEEEVDFYSESIWSGWHAGMYWHTDFPSPSPLLYPSSFPM